MNSTLTSTLQFQQAPGLSNIRRPAPDRRLRQRVRRPQRVCRRAALLVPTHLPLLYTSTQGKLNPLKVISPRLNLC